jgi:isopenicillin-N epimerase
VGGRDWSWKDEFQWLGTRDPAVFLAVPAAIAYLEDVGWEAFRNHGHALARAARARISERTGLEPLSSDSAAWHGPMVSIPIPSEESPPRKPNEPDPLQVRLWEQYRIEVPVFEWRGRRLIRTSFYLYNDGDDLERLLGALGELGAV